MVIFEDNQNSPISKLIKQIMGPRCAFAGRNEDMASIINYYANSGEDVICYVDCVPDNPNTENLYLKLLRLYSGYDNVYILRIPCIEFIVLQLLLSLNVLDRANEDVKKFCMSLSSYGIEYSAKSYERFCKGVLNASRKICVKNTIPRHMYNFISWYESECVCDDVRFSNNCSRYSMLQKMLALAYYMPYYENDKRLEPFISKGLLKKRSIKEAREYCEEIRSLVWKALNNRKEA